MHVESDAFGHTLDVVFVEASGRAMVTFLGAKDTRLDTRLMLLVSHRISPFRCEYSGTKATGGEFYAAAKNCTQAWQWSHR